MKHWLSGIYRLNAAFRYPMMALRRIERGSEQWVPRRPRPIPGGGDHESALRCLARRFSLDSYERAALHMRLILLSKSEVYGIENARKISLLSARANRTSDCGRSTPNAGY